MEHLIATVATDIGSVFGQLSEMPLKIEREQYLKVELYQRTPERQGYANGYKPKNIDTLARTVTIQIPKKASHGDSSFYPHSLELEQRSSRTVMLAMAKMYNIGVSTLQAEDVIREFGIERLSSTQVIRAAELLDEEMAAWRNRPIGQMKYLILDPCYKETRHDGVARDTAMLSTIGIGLDEHRYVPELFVPLAEAKLHRGKY